MRQRTSFMEDVQHERDIPMLHSPIVTFLGPRGILQLLHRICQA